MRSRPIWQGVAQLYRLCAIRLYLPRMTRRPVGLQPIRSAVQIKPCRRNPVGYPPNDLPHKEPILQMVARIAIAHDRRRAGIANRTRQSWVIQPRVRMPTDTSPSINTIWRTITRGASDKAVYIIL